MKSIDKLKQFFNINNWQIGQPIIIADIVSEILSVEGVALVVPPREDKPDLIIVENRWNSNLGYSGNMYDISNATYNGIVYPAVDPSIFEVKFLNSDIIFHIPLVLGHNVF